MIRKIAGVVAAISLGITCVLAVLDLGAFLGGIEMTKFGRIIWMIAVGLTFAAGFVWYGLRSLRLRTRIFLLVGIVIYWLSCLLLAGSTLAFGYGPWTNIGMLGIVVSTPPIAVWAWWRLFPKK